MMCVCGCVWVCACVGVCVHMLAYLRIPVHLMSIIIIMIELAFHFIDRETDYMWFFFCVSLCPCVGWT